MCPVNSSGDISRRLELSNKVAVLARKPFAVPVSDAAAVAGFSRTHLMRLVESRRLETVIVNGRVWVVAVSLLKYMRRKR